jgi:hypothetical protein
MNKNFKLDIYEVVDGTDNWPLIDTVYGETEAECIENAEAKYGPNADGYHWTNPTEA